jgi:hypothetical protein
MVMVAHPWLSKAEDTKGWRGGAAMNVDHPFLVRYADLVFVQEPMLLAQRRSSR